MSSSPRSPGAGAASGSDLIRAVVILLAALFMVGANGAVVRRQVDVSTGQAEGNIVPAAWAFGIWGVIFLLVIGFGVYAVLPTNPGRDLARAAGYPAALAFVTAGLWPIATAYSQFDVAQALIVAMWVALAVAYLRIAAVRTATPAERWLGGLTFGLFFGWVTAANAVSIQSRVAGWGASEQAISIVGVIALIAAGAIAAWFIHRGQGGIPQLWMAYAAAVGWALIAIVVRQAGASPVGVAAAAIAAIPAAVAIVSGIRSAAPAMQAGRSA